MLSDSIPMSQAGVGLYEANLAGYGSTRRRLLAMSLALWSEARQASTQRRSAMTTTRKSREAIASADTRPIAQVIPFPIHHPRPSFLDSDVDYEESKEYHERIARIRDKLEKIHRLMEQTKHD